MVQNEHVCCNNIMHGYQGLHYWKTRVGLIGIALVSRKSAPREVLDWEYQAYSRQCGQGLVAGRRINQEVIDLQARTYIVQSQSALLQRD